MCFNNYKFLLVEISVSPTVFVAAKTVMGSHLFFFQTCTNSKKFGPKAQRKIRSENVFINF